MQLHLLRLHNLHYGYRIDSIFIDSEKLVTTLVNTASYSQVCRNNKMTNC